MEPRACKIHLTPTPARQRPIGRAQLRFRCLGECATKSTCTYFGWTQGVLVPPALRTPSPFLSNRLNLQAGHASLREAFALECKAARRNFASAARQHKGGPAPAARVLLQPLPLPIRHLHRPRLQASSPLKLPLLVRYVLVDRDRARFVRVHRLQIGAELLLYLVLCDAAAATAQASVLRQHGRAGHQRSAWA
eukprot:7065873-Prymnesium_polylepis.1